MALGNIDVVEGRVRIAQETATSFRKVPLVASVKQLSPPLGFDHQGRIANIEHQLLKFGLGLWRDPGPFNP